MRPRLALLFMLLLAPLAAPGAAHAQPQDAQPLDRLLPEIRRTVPGQFLDAQGINRNGSPGYRLKWLTPEGRVIERDVDARTGRMMGPDRSNFNREGFGPRESGARQEGPRGNARPFSQDDEGGTPRFGNRGFPPRDFNQERQERFGNQERFNRPGFGRGERFGGPQRFGGDGAGERRGYGGGRARGREGED